MPPPTRDQTPTLPFNRQHLTPGHRVCVAVSGGADSVALLRALHAATQPSPTSLGVGLSAAHLHHGLRGPEADADLHFVADLCATLDLPLHTHHVDVAAHAGATGETLEEAARTLRYAFFTSLLRSGQADAVLTAHTLDDQAETVLMKLLRGAWTEGLGGIHPVLRIDIPKQPASQPAKQILRPLLSTSRAEVEAYLRALHQLWREDSSNQDPAFTRNRLRHDLLPGLRAFNPSLDHTLSHLSEIAREEELFWQAELDRHLPHLLLPGKPVRGGGRAVSTAPAEASLALEIERLRPLPAALRRRILRAAARQLGARLSFEETERLLALCGFVPLPTVSSRNGATLQLAHGLRAERSLRELRLSRSAITSAEQK